MVIRDLSNVHTMAGNVSCCHKKLFGIMKVWIAIARDDTSLSHTLNIVPARLAERVGALDSSPHS